MTTLLALAVLFALTQLGDYYTTYVVIKQGGHERENELGLTWRLINRLGVVPGLVVAKGIALVAGGVIYVDGQVGLLAALDALYVWQVWQNWIRIKR